MESVDECIQNNTQNVVDVKIFKVLKVTLGWYSQYESQQKKNLPDSQNNMRR